MPPLLVRALRARRSLNLGLLGLGALAVGAAVAAPMFARGGAEHLLDQRAAQRPPYTTGLNLELYPYSTIPGRTVDQSGGVLDSEGRELMLDRIMQLAGPSDSTLEWQSATPYMASSGEIQDGAAPFSINTYWRDGMCAHARITGRCPAQEGEALVDPRMMRALGLKVGDTLSVDFSSAVDRPVTVDLTPDFRIVGTYTIPDPSDPYWYDPGRTSGDGTLRSRAAAGAKGLPQAPALLVDPSSLTVAAATRAGADRALDLSTFNIDTTDDAQHGLIDWHRQLEVAGPPVLPVGAPNSLENLVQQVNDERSLLTRVTITAVAPLTALAVMLVYVLVAAAANVRRPEVALAKLRGHPRWRVMSFAVAEPMTVFALAAALGAALGIGGERALAWLLLGQTPVVLTAASLAAGAVVVVAGVAAIVAGVLAVVREPLGSSISGRVRRRSASRLSLLAQGGLLALAVAAVIQVRTSEAGKSTSYLELTAPLLVALGGSVLALVAVRGVARAWVRLTATREGVASFLAARRLARSQDLLPFVIPILVTTSTVLFASSTWLIASQWRDSRAAAEIGAAERFVTTTDPARLLWVTHQADPDAHYLAAAVPPAPRTSDGARVALVDASRIAAVLAWDTSWGSASPAVLQTWLSPPPPDPVGFNGRHLEARITTADLRGTLNFPVDLWIRYVSNTDGSPHNVRIGHLPRSGQADLKAAIGGCDDSCTFEQLYIAGSASSVTDAKGSLTIASITSDGTTPGDWQLDNPDRWRPARPYGTEDATPIRLDASPGGLVLDLDPAEATIARITTNDHPDAPTLVVTDQTALTTTAANDGTVDGATLLGQRTPMVLKGRTRTLPLVGTNGGLSDLASAIRDFGDASIQVTTTDLLVAPGTPSSVLDAVRAQGVALDNGTTLQDREATLRTDAYALGWNIFLVTCGVNLALAVAGLLALAATQLRRRSHEAAALRVVGLRRASLRNAITAEQAVLTLVAVTMGAALGLISILALTPTLTFGESATFDPTPDLSIRWPLVVAAPAIVAALMLIVSRWNAHAAVARGNPVDLRNAAEE